MKASGKKKPKKKLDMSPEAVTRRAYEKEKKQRQRGPDKDSITLNVKLLKNERENFEFLCNETGLTATDSKEELVEAVKLILKDWAAKTAQELSQRDRQTSQQSGNLKK
jgi:hypothetical protein